MSRGRAFFKSSLLLPSVTSSQLRFISLRKPKLSSKFVRMSTDSSSSNNNSAATDVSAAAAATGDGASTSHSAALSPSKIDYSTSSASSAIDFLSLCHRLKTTKRTGWVRREIQDPESIADHMYRMSIMALIASDIPGVDRDRCIKMAIVHDIAEAIVGDITPSDGVPKLEKSRREREALEYMCKLLGGGSRAKEIGELWMEYEENSSAEAKVVKDFDKVEMILQALEYESDLMYERLTAENGFLFFLAGSPDAEQGKNLDEFFQSTAGKFQTDVGKAWASEIASRRRKEH